jgi:hypothetical protein
MATRLSFTTVEDIPVVNVSDIEAFAKAIIKGGEAKIYGIERRPGETDDELAKRVTMAKSALK